MTKKLDLLAFVSGYNNNTGIDSTNELRIVINAAGIGVVITKCSGGYEGTQENCLMITCQTTEQIDIIKSLAFKRYRQKAVMVRHGDSSVTIEQSNNEISLFSALELVSEETAKKHGFYTLVNNQYWVTYQKAV